MTADRAPRASEPFIASSRRSPYFGHPMLRLVSSLLIAFALLFAPLGMMNGAAQAATHSDAVIMTSAGGHCAGTEAPSKSEKSHAKMTCALSCAAVPAAAPLVAEDLVPNETRLVLGDHQQLYGIGPEGETPPPRNTSEI